MTVSSARTYVVTGSASGIGRATMERLLAQGSRVVGVDLHDAEVAVDLATVDGRATLVEQVESLCDGVVDGVIACAGISPDGELCVRVNYFGAVATLAGLRPLLARSSAPAAVVIASMGALFDFDRTVLAECLAGREEMAAAAGKAAVDNGDAAGRVYCATKRAIARWVRTHAVTEAWAGAGAGIALNAIAPGVIATPMTGAADDDPERHARRAASMPMPLGGPGAPPEHPAALLAWLAGPDNRMMAGQVIFIDGGYEAIRRGDDVFPTYPIEQKL
jgi:NAD(P)-dependent dehydrogenase (short-subunit alcohol dehydrogenase family)